MIVFVEGPDGSGKSTLIEQLKERYITARVSKAAESKFVWDKLKVLGRQLGEDTVLMMDRSPLTEYVYRSEDNSDAKFTYSFVLGWLRGGKLIYCKSNTSHEDAMNRGEDNITSKTKHDRIEQLYDTFISTLSKEGVRIMYYNWRENSPEDVINFIEGKEN